MAFYRVPTRTLREANIICRKKTSFKKALLSVDKSAFLLAEKVGFEPTRRVNALRDFESVRLLGSYRTILPQSRLILVVVFQLLNASAIMSSLLDRWREGQTHWRYYSTKTPKNQGVLRK